MAKEQTGLLDRESWRKNWIGVESIITVKTVTKRTSDVYNFESIVIYACLNVVYNKFMKLIFILNHMYAQGQIATFKTIFLYDHK